MSKITCLILCAVAVSINAAANKPTLRDLYRPVIVQCSQEHGVTDADLQAAADSGDASKIKPCFLGCVFLKSGLINSKGDYDLATGLTNLKQFVPDKALYDEIAEVIKKCESVQATPVSDGAAGCEKGALITKCFLENRTNILV